MDHEMIGYVKGRACTGWACNRKMTPVLEPHNSVFPRFCWDLELSRAGPPGVGRVGLVDPHVGETLLVSFTGKWG